MSLSHLAAWGSTCSPCLLSKEALLCLPAQPQECGGAARRLNRAVEGHQPSSRTCFVQGGTGALPEPYNMISSKLFMCRLSESESTRVVWGPDVPLWDLFTPALRSLTEHQKWPVCRWDSVLPCGEQIHSEPERVWRSWANVTLLPTSSSMTGLAVGQWWSGGFISFSHTDLHRLCWRYQDGSIRLIMQANS